jgi:hypothetical protein
MTIATTGLGLAGLALLAVETVRVLNNTVLDSVSTALLFVGVGLVVVSGLLAVISVTGDRLTAPATEDGAPSVISIPEPAVVSVADPVADPATVTLPEAAAVPARPAVSPARAAGTPARPGKSALATLRTRSTISLPAEATVTGGAVVAAPVAPDSTTWTLLCRADGAGQLAANSETKEVRRGATLIAYREGVLIGIGPTQLHQPWATIHGVNARLGGGEATISVQFDRDGTPAEATFTGKNGELAPVATALVTAAPAGVVDVSYA